MTTSESDALLRQKQPESNASAPLDVPFTVAEKIKWTIAMLVIPWLVWFPLIWFGAFIRTCPSTPWFTGLWLSPLVLTIAYMVCWMMLMDRPRILRERVRRGHMVGEKPEEPLEERQAQNILMALILTMVFGSAYDAAARNSLPALVYATGSVLVVLSLSLVAWVLRENTWAAKVVYKQEGQVLITTGPYSLVRHPFYTFFSMMLVGLPLMIGSYWGMIPGALCVPALMWRAYHEEKFLLREFGHDYERYGQRVPYRMFPGIY